MSAKLKKATALNIQEGLISGMKSLEAQICSLKSFLKIDAEESEEADDEEEEEEEAPSKKSKKGSKKKPVDEDEEEEEADEEDEEESDEEDEESEDEEESEDDEDESEEDEDSDDEEDEKPAKGKKGKAPSREALVKACQAHAKKVGNKAKTVKVLKKFGYSNVDDVPAEKRAKVIAALTG